MENIMVCRIMDTHSYFFLQLTWSLSLTCSGSPPLFSKGPSNTWSPVTSEILRLILGSAGCVELSSHAVWDTRISLILSFDKTWDRDSWKMQRTVIKPFHLGACVRAGCRRATHLWFGCVLNSAYLGIREDVVVHIHLRVVMQLLIPNRLECKIRTPSRGHVAVQLRGLLCRLQNQLGHLRSTVFPTNLIHYLINSDLEKCKILIWYSPLLRSHEKHFVNVFYMSATVPDNLCKRYCSVIKNLRTAPGLHAET